MYHFEEICSVADLQKRHQAVKQAVMDKSSTSALSDEWMCWFVISCCSWLHYKFITTTVFCFLLALFFITFPFIPQCNSGSFHSVINVFSQFGIEIAQSITTVSTTIPLFFKEHNKNSLSTVWKCVLFYYYFFSHRFQFKKKKKINK